MLRQITKLPVDLFFAAQEMPLDLDDHIVRDRRASIRILRAIRGVPGRRERARPQDPVRIFR